MLTTADIQHHSLENLGILAANDENFVEVADEVIRRCNSQLALLAHFLDYHTNEFKKQASAKHWNELIAIKAGYQVQQQRERHGQRLAACPPGTN